MDPFAISMAVAPLVLSSVKLAMLVRTLKKSYKNAPITLVATTAECELMHVTLCKIPALIYRNATDLAKRLDSQKDLREACDNALTGCRMTLAALNMEVGKSVEPTQSDQSGKLEVAFKAKAMILWKEDVMKGLLDLIQEDRWDHCTCSLHSLNGSENQSEIARLVRQNATALNVLLHKAKSIRSSQGYDDAQSSFHLCSQSVAYGLAQTYEEQLAQSSAYQRAQKAAAEELLASKLQLLEEKFELEDKYEFLSLEMTSKDERVSRLENSVSVKEKIVLLREGRITKLEGEIGSKNRDLAANEILIAELMHQKSIPKAKGEAETEKARIIELEHEIVLKNQDFASKEKTIADLRLLLSNKLLKITFAENTIKELKHELSLMKDKAAPSPLSESVSGPNPDGEDISPRANSFRQSYKYDRYPLANEKKFVYQPGDWAQNPYFYD